MTDVTYGILKMMDVSCGVWICINVWIGTYVDCTCVDCSTDKTKIGHM